MRYYAVKISQGVKRVVAFPTEQMRTSFLNLSLHKSGAKAFRAESIFGLKCQVPVFLESDLRDKTVALWEQEGRRIRVHGITRTSELVELA